MRALRLAPCGAHVLCARHCTRVTPAVPVRAHRSVSTWACGAWARPEAGTAVAAAVAAAALLLLLPSAGHADELPIAGVFTSKCAGCHKNGGNILQPGATLFEEDLAKNGVDSPEALFNIIYAGKNKMPGYGTDCTPRGQCTFGPRLSDDEVTAMVGYIKERAAAKWQ